MTRKKGFEAAGGIISFDGGLACEQEPYRQNGNPRVRRFRRDGTGVAGSSAEICSGFRISTRYGTAKMKDFSAA